MGKSNGLFAWRFFHLAFLLVLAALSLAAYSNSFDAALLFDDLDYITGDRAMQDPANIPRILFSPRGVIRTSFALNYAAGGTEVGGYHAVNFAVHLASACLAYLFILLTTRLAGLAEEKARLVSAFTALLFALHPLQTQAVTYIVQRMESMASLFMLGGMVLFIMGAASKGFKRWVLFLLVGLSYLLGFYSKPVAYTLPALVLLYDLFFTTEGGFMQRLRGVLGKWPVYALLSVLFVVFTVQTVVPMSGLGKLSGQTPSAPVQATEDGGAGTAVKRPAAGAPEATAGFSIASYTPKEYLYTQFNVLVYYLSLFAVPANQQVDYDFPVSRDLFTTPGVHPGTALNIPIPPPVVSLAILLAIAAAGVVLAARSFATGGFTGRLVAYFVFWFFIILAPTSSFIPIADVLFEHRVYLPGLGVFAAFTCLFFTGAERVGRGGRGLAAAAVVALVIALALGAATFNRNRAWADPVRLWSDNLAKAPGKARVSNNLGYAIVMGGGVREAAGHFSRAVELDPEYFEARKNLGFALLRLGSLFEARVHLAEAVALEPRSREALNYLALTNLKLGDPEGAERFSRRALALSPGFADAHSVLGISLVEQGDVEGGLPHLAEAVRIRPGYTYARFNLAKAYARAGMYAEAVEHFRIVLRKRPGDAEVLRELDSALRRAEQEGP